MNIGDAPDEVLRWLLARIRAQPPIGLGLQTTVKAHETTKRTAFYVSAPTNMCVFAHCHLIHKCLIDFRAHHDDIQQKPNSIAFRLFRAAEEARLPKRLRPELGGALREFTTRESHCFAQIKGTDGTSTLFTSQERQWLVLQVLQGLRAGSTDLEALHGSATVQEGQSIGTANSICQHILHGSGDVVCVCAQLIDFCLPSRYAHFLSRFEQSPLGYRAI